MGSSGQGNLQAEVTASAEALRQDVLGVLGGRARSLSARGLQGWEVGMASGGRSCTPVGPCKGLDFKGVGDPRRLFSKEET